MRYFIIFSITLIISLLLIFYPRNYLMKFDNEININYEDITKDNLWKYEMNNDNLKLKNNVNNLWTFVPNKNGKTILTFYYDKKEDGYKYKIIYELEVKNNKIIWLEGEAFGLINYPNPY